MATYKALTRGYIPASATPVKRPEMTGERRVMRVVEAGEVFEFTGKPGKWMEPYKGETAQGSTAGKPARRNSKGGETAQGSTQAQPTQEGGHGDDSP